MQIKGQLTLSQTRLQELMVGLRMLEPIESTDWISLDLITDYWLVAE